MNRALIVREMTVIGRQPAIAIASCVHAIALSLFVFIWRGGVPVAIGRNLYDQAVIVDVFVLAAILPWAVARAVPSESADAVTMTSALGALVPSQLVIARATAAAIAAAIVTMSGAAALEIARRMSGVPWPAALAAAASLGAFGTVVAVIQTTPLLIGLRRIAAWLVGAPLAVLGALVAAVDHQSTSAGVAAIVLSIALVALASVWADRQRLYLREPRSRASSGLAA